VLKCLFMGIPLDLITGLSTRLDQTLRDMVAAYAQERTVAGRAVPADAQRILDLSTNSTETES
jgi:L-ribulose-5-phosphate 3-epimerase